MTPLITSAHTHRSAWMNSPSPPLRLICLFEQEQGRLHLGLLRGGGLDRAIVVSIDAAIAVGSPEWDQVKEDLPPCILAS